LIAGSPAIDRGTGSSAPTDDLDGNPRPTGSAVDIGAYEFCTSCSQDGGTLGDGGSSGDGGMHNGTGIPPGSTFEPTPSGCNFGGRAAASAALLAFFAVLLLRRRRRVG
jgi:hypothetical protein